VEECDLCDAPMEPDKIYSIEIEEHEEPLVVCKECYDKIVQRI